MLSSPVSPAAFYLRITPSEEAILRGIHNGTSKSQPEISSNLGLSKGFVQRTLTELSRAQFIQRYSS